MSDTLGVTLSHEDRQRRPAGLVEEPALILALECGRPRALSMRLRLGGINQVHLGRGSVRSVERSGDQLTIKIPDKWMSSKHARLERSFGRWLLVDTESKNGSMLDGVATKQAPLTDGALLELGHTFLVFAERMVFAETDEPDLDLEKMPPDVPGLATCVAELGLEMARLRRVAASEISILLEGETGTGKELLARAIHQLSGRPGDFVAVNCGALPANLVEGELFGYRKGAFSGAAIDHPGLIRASDRGTLFLDEIGDLPPLSQAALLRALQEREVLPLGGTKPVPVDLRVVAATHRDLDEMVGDEAFRNDLFARLAGFRLEVPPLAERRADLGLLIGLLHQRIFGAAHPGFDVDAARLLFRYGWPFNVRELEQALATAAVLAAGHTVLPEHLPDAVRSGRAPTVPRQVVLSEADQKQREALVSHLAAQRGNLSAVARAMGKDRKQIQRWMKRFELDAAEYR